MDGIASWTWSGCESKPVQVEVYAPGDTAAQLLNGVKVAEGKLEGYRTTLTVDYTPGELTAVALANALSRDRAVVNSVILPHFLITRSFGLTIDHYLDNQSYHRRRRATSAIALSEQNSHESETIKSIICHD